MGGYSGTIDSNFTQASMIVDYVRVYQSAPLSDGENLSLGSRLKIFPNPGNDKIHVTSKTAIQSLALYDMFGKLILEKENDTKNIDVSGLNSGMYFLEVYSENEKAIRKVIIN